MNNEQDTILLGIVGIKNMGDYDAETSYEKLNVVTYQGSTYCALRDTVGKLPTNTEYWQLYAQKGDVGPQGVQGPKPVKGVDYYTTEDKEAISEEIVDAVSDEVSTTVGSLVSATPLAASSISGMTDTSRIYVNTTDGHWYWYDGNDWQDGGVYQATEDSDTVELLKNKMDLIYKNYPFYNPTVTKGEPSVGSSEISTSVFRYSTEKIDLHGETSIKLTFKNNTDKTLSFYPYYFDSNGECASRGSYYEVSPNSTSTKNFESNVLSGVSYIAFSGKSTDVVDLTSYLSTIAGGIKITFNKWETELLKDDLGTTYNTVIERLANDEERINDLETTPSLIPSYFENNLNSAISKIKENMREVGRNGETFAFITDLHWENNTKHSPELLKEIVKQTNLKYVVCGGDLFNYSNTKADAIEKLETIMSQFKYLGSDFITIFGNHDSNNQPGDPDLLIEPNTVYELMFKHQEPNVTVWNEEYWDQNPYSQYCFYKDNNVTKTRMIFISSAHGSIGHVQINWLTDVLNKNDDYKVLIFVHWIYNNHAYTPNGNQLKTLIDNYTTKVKGIIAGHLHYDKVDHTQNGIPIVFTTTDSHYPLPDDNDYQADGTVGTINEQAFDVITVNYETGTIKCVRIGRDSDRTVYNNAI